MDFLSSREFWVLAITWLVMYLIVKEQNRALKDMRRRIEYMEQHATFPRDMRASAAVLQAGDSKTGSGFAETGY